MEDTPQEPLSRKAVRWSGLAGVSGLYLFVSAFGVAFAARIVHQYLFANPDTWGSGFNSLWFPALGIYTHWCGGCMILLVGMVQLFGFTRRPYMIIHRVLGTIYIIGGLFTSLGGLTFIFTHGCVGGTNMNVAFGVYGVLVFVFTILTYYYARKHDVTAHRDYAIRLWGQGIGSLMYRVWYFLLAVTTVYPDASFTRTSPLDIFLDWWFFVPNLIVTELIVMWLHRRDAKRAASLTAQSAASNAAQPLLP